MTLVWKPGLILQSPTANDPLLDLNTQPSLDLQFATSKTLNDRVSGQNLITFSRSTTGTYVDSNGIIQTAAIDAPRFDHDPTTGESLGLLIEESRTNPLKYSGELDRSTDWNVTGGSTSNTTAPDNTNDAVIFTEDTATNYHGFNAQGGNRPTMSGQIAASVFIKPGTRRYVVISFGAGSNGVCVTVDTQNMTVSEATSYGTGYTYTAGSATIDSAGNNWHRVSFAGNSSASTDQVFIIRGTNIATGNTFGESYLGDGSTFSSWGAQLEAGAFPTSYIPTSGSTVPRAADVASITGSNFSRWYNQSEGTIVVNFITGYQVGVNCPIGSLNDGTTSQRISLRPRNTVYGNLGVASLTVSETPPGILDKIAWSFDSSGFSLISGADSDLYTSPLASQVLTQLEIGKFESGADGIVNGTISRLTYYPYRLPDATLQEITS